MNPRRTPPIARARRLLRAAAVLLALVFGTAGPAGALFYRNNIQGLPKESVAYFNACVTMSHFFSSQNDQQAYRERCCGDAEYSCRFDCLGSTDMARQQACELACADAESACQQGAYVDAEGNADTGYYANPMVEEIRPSPRVDYCLDGNSGCGAPAAHTFCERYRGAGWVATDFGFDERPTSLDDPTWQLGRWYPRQPYGTGMGFSFIQCEASSFVPSLQDVPNDQDLDGLADAADNCARLPNPLQQNADGDLFGDACDPEPNVAYACSNGVDDDGDGFADAADSGCLGYDDDSEGSLTLDDGLVGHWPLDGNASDASGNGHDGRVFGAVPAFDLQGSSDAALSFDGVDDFVEVDVSNGLQPELPVTIAALVRPECAANTCWILDNDAHPSRYSGISFALLSGGRLYAVYGDGGTPASYNRRDAHTGPVVPDGRWSHVAVVVHGPTDFRFFVDGVQVERSSVAYDGTGGPLTYHGQPVNIGLDPFFSEKSFRGDLDEVRLYDRALRPSEVAALDPRHCLGADELAGRWDFAGDARDSSGCGHHGVVRGATSTTDLLGRSAEAFAFDGDDVIEIAPAGVLKPELPATLFLRMKSECPAGERCFAFENDADPERYSGLSLQVGPDGRLELRVGDGGTPSSRNRHSAITDDPIVPGRWVDVAAVVRGPQDVEIYVDGIRQHVSYSGSGGPLAYLGGPVLIGSHGFGVSPFQGSLDDVQLFDRALAPSEVIALPEPAGATGMLMGLGGLAALARRRRTTDARQGED